MTATTDPYGGLVRPGESLAHALRRLERRRDYVRVLGTDAGQRLLDAIWREQRAARRVG